MNNNKFKSNKNFGNRNNLISSFFFLLSASLINSSAVAQVDTPPGIPDDPNGFLQFINKSAPMYKQELSTPDARTDDTAARAYYAAIDPTDRRLTLTDFNSANGLDLGVDALAVYVNDADLGFGRRMVTRVNPDNSVASCVENYGDNLGTVNGPAQEKIDNAKLQRNLLATVCMEYSGTPGAVIAPTPTLVAENNDVSSKNLNSRINITLQPGHYQLVAATALANQFGGFTLKVSIGKTTIAKYSGKWTNSGGQDYNSPDNPKYALDVMSAATYTINLTSRTDPYLYLLQLPPNEQLAGRKFTKFYAYGADGNRIYDADLDGRAADANGVPNAGVVKYMPTLCVVCHGGKPKSLVNGVYPDNGDTGAQFLPWDLNTFVYDATDPAFSRAAQEPLFKIFNQSVLATYPAPITRTWTGNAAIPDGDYNGVTLPLTVSGINDNETINQIVLSIDGSVGGTPGIQHSNPADLHFVLYSPSGIMVDSFYNTTEGVGADMSQVYFIPGMVNYFPRPPGSGNPSAAPFNGNYSAGFALSQLKGTPINGTWKLQVIDTYTGNTGFVKSWSLHFNGIPEQARLPAPVELIRGWYGGKNLPSSTFNGDFVPVGWLPPAAPIGADQLYLKVLAPTCRACHAQRGELLRNELDFASYDKFMSYADEIESLVYDKGLMPLAKRTYQNHFWETVNGVNKAEVLGDFLPNFSHRVPGSTTEVLKPGRPIANAGVNRTRQTLQVLPVTTTKLDGRASLFADGYNWSMVSRPAGSTTILYDSTTATPNFTPDLTGDYQFSLQVNKGAEVSTPSTVTVTVSSTARRQMSFATDVLGSNGADIGGSCSGCHNEPYLTPFFPNANSPAVDLDRGYSNMIDRINLLDPEDSLLLTKNQGEPHDGGRAYHTSFGNPFVASDYVLRWIMEGAPR